MLEKVNLNQVLAIGIVGLAINILFVGCGKSSSIDKLQSNTNSTMGTIKAESAIVGVGVERIIRTTGNIGESVSNAQREIDESRRASESIASGIEQLKRRVRECQRLASENTRIIEQVDGAN